MVWRSSPAASRSSASPVWPSSFAVGGPFGTINDWTIGIFGILTGLLVVQVERRPGTVGSTAGSGAGVIAVAGAVIVLIGAALVISDSTGFLLAGLVESLGFAVIPGIAMGLDDMDAAPGWVWLGFVGWLGIFFLYPIWSIWFGTVLRRGSREGSGSKP